MKKIFFLIAAVVMTAGVASAQDLNQATENYNNGAMELQNGNNAATALLGLLKNAMGATGSAVCDFVAEKIGRELDFEVPGTCESCCHN